jgi:hypothetical protein
VVDHFNFDLAGFCKFVHGFVKVAATKIRGDGLACNMTGDPVAFALQFLPDRRAGSL